MTKIEGKPEMSCYVRADVQVTVIEEERNQEIQPARYEY